MKIIIIFLFACSFVILILVIGVESIKSSSVVIIGHRGASGYLPEHTLPSKAFAYAQGVDYLEQDVVLSKDNIPIVIHDIHLDEVSNVASEFSTRNRSDGRFYVVDFTAAEIKHYVLVNVLITVQANQYFQNVFHLINQHFI
jgi:glycerophosphoryl diester phosphodiesterase